MSEKATGGASGDFVWRSAMDLQVKLVSDGYALAHASPEVPNCGHNMDTRTAASKCRFVA